MAKVNLLLRATHNEENPMKRCANGTRRVWNVCKRQPPNTLGAVGVHVGTKSALWKKGYGRKSTPGGFPWGIGAAVVGVGILGFGVLAAITDPAEKARREELRREELDKQTSWWQSASPGQRAEIERLARVNTADKAAWVQPSWMTPVLQVIRDHRQGSVRTTANPRKHLRSVDQRRDDLARQGINPDIVDSPLTYYTDSAKGKDAIHFGSPGSPVGDSTINYRQDEGVLSKVRDYTIGSGGDSLNVSVNVDGSEAWMFTSYGVIKLADLAPDGGLAQLRSRDNRADCYRIVSGPLAGSVVVHYNDFESAGVTYQWQVFSNQWIALHGGSYIGDHQPYDVAIL